MGLRDRRIHAEDRVSPFGRSAGSDRAGLYHDIAAGEILEGLFSEERGHERGYHTDTQLSSVYDEDAGVGPGRIETNVGETTIEVTSIRPSSLVTSARRRSDAPTRCFRRS